MTAITIELFDSRREQSVDCVTWQNIVIKKSSVLIESIKLQLKLNVRLNVVLINTFFMCYKFSRRLTSMPPSVPIGIRILASFREPEDSGNVKRLVLRVFTPGDGALRHADLEVPPLFVEQRLVLLVCSVVIRRRVLGGAGIVVVHQVGHLRDSSRRRRRRRLHTVGFKVSRKLTMILGIDEIEQRLTQQFVLRNSNNLKFRETRV